MKNLFFLFFSLIVVFSSNAQIRYEKAYFIGNNDQRTECFIKNVDWKNNPTKFQYKLSETAEPQVAEIYAVKEFGIYNGSKYVRADVKIDRSSVDRDHLSNSANPEFSGEQVFLKVLVEGPATLYSYEEKNLKKFFYKTENSPIEQLIYKEYAAGANNIGYNRAFRYQLFSQVNCNNIPFKTIQRINYIQKALEDYFREHNQCKGQATPAKAAGKNNLFNFRITTGLNYASMKLKNPYHHNGLYSEDFGSQLNFRAGFQVEAVLPFNKNKWSFFIDPSYNYFQNSVKRDTGDVVFTVNYKYLEFPFGLRHYFFLKPDCKLFVNPAFGLGSFIDFKSFVKVEDDIIPYPYSGSYVISMSPNATFALGVGMEYKRLMAEIRFTHTSNLTPRYIYWRTNYTKCSFILGIRLGS